MEYPATEDRVVEERDSSIGRLFSELLRDLGTLFRQELTLAKCELSEKALEAKGGATKFGIGVGLGLAGVLVLAAALVLGLTAVLSTWMAPLVAGFISALLIGAGLAAGAYALIRQGGASLNPSHFVPEQTLESLKENTRWAKEKV